MEKTPQEVQITPQVKFYISTLTYFSRKNTYRYTPGGGPAPLTHPVLTDGPTLDSDSITEAIRKWTAESDKSQSTPHPDFKLAPLRFKILGELTQSRIDLIQSGTKKLEVNLFYDILD